MAGVKPHSITLPASISTQLIAHAIDSSPFECCGLLAAEAGMIKQVFKITNTDPGRHAFSMAPAELVNSFHRIEDLGLKVAAIYHSHPHSEAIPSETDIAQNYYPDIPQVIIGKNAHIWEVRCYMIWESSITEIDVILPSS